MIGPEGEVFDYTFDVSNRMTSMTRDGAPVASWEFDRAGRKRRMTLGNGVEALYNFGELLSGGEPVPIQGLRGRTGVSADCRTSRNRPPCLA